MPEKRRTRIATYIGILGCVAALFCSPPLAEKLLALEPMHPEDILPLWTFSLLLLGVSVYVTFRESRMREPLAAMMLPLLALIVLETAARTYVNAISMEDRGPLILLARRTYRDQMAFQPHPFLQFTGRSKTIVHGTESLGTMLPFNELGFNSRMLPKSKPLNGKRIICLGGSTTGDGYPAELEQVLQPRVGDSQRIETMSFGLGWYTSTHSVVNFVLNALDYSPDYVVFHHAINDARGHGRIDGVRGDYMHLCKPFEYPQIKDAYLIRASVIYRYFQHLFNKTPYWAFLDSAVVREGKKKDGDPYTDPADLEPYERNIRTIVDLALVRGITPVLATQPHSTDPATHVNLATKGLDRCNNAVRRLAEEYQRKQPGRVILVDLDARCTGQNDLFVDIVHMTDRGIGFKAQAIADAIHAHLRSGDVTQAREHPAEN